MEKLEDYLKELNIVLSDEIRKNLKGELRE